jgi:curli production assembly/transport component CsgF
VLGIASANNEYDGGKDDRDFFRRDPVQDFAITLQSRLLSRISEDIVGAIFGEEAQDAGTFRVGTTVIDFARQGEVINIKIADEATGSETAIDVPVPRL